MGNDRPEDRGGRGVTVIYLDELFLLNFVVDYLLLLAAGRLSGEILRRGWLALGAAIGAAYAAAAVLPGMGFLLHPLCKLGAAVLALLADINQRLNLTIVLITHQLEVVKTICDHAALLEQGEIVESGKLADLLVTPWSRLRQSLLHDPQAEQDFLTRHGVQGRPLCGVA